LRCGAERGHDPRDFVLVASGGNGGLHAPLIARELSIPKVIMPVLPAHCSATGMLMTDLRHDYVRTNHTPLQDADFAKVRAICAEFEREGDRLLEREAVPPDRRDMRRSLDMRFVGQEYYLNVPVSADELERADRAATRSKFEKVHARQYGQVGGHSPVEIVNVRVSAHGLRPKLPLRPDLNGSAGTVVTREVILTDASRPVRCAIVPRASLAVGEAVNGPAIIEEDASTVLLLEGDRATLAPTGEIIIDIGAG
jgi:N-methylhydantoinase A